MKGIAMNTSVKIVALFAVVAAVACSTPKTNPPKQIELNLDEVNLVWRGEYDSKNHRMHYFEEWSGCGWWFGDDILKSSGDLSEFDQVVVEVNNITPDTAELYLNIRYTTTNIITSETAPIVNGRTTLRVNLDPKGKSHIHEIFVMSKSSCDLTIKKALLKETTKYGAARELKAKDGYIKASEFNGYSDDALVSFNYYVAGEMTYMNADSGHIEPMNNWGIGYVRSSADLTGNDCPGQHIILKKLGEQSYQCALGDIRYMIDYNGRTGMRGLHWKVWPGGNLTDVHIINATISEVAH